MNKKAASILVMIFELLAVVMVVSMTIFIARSYAASDFVEKNNIVEDLSLMVNTLVGVEGNAAVIYDKYDLSNYTIFVNEHKIILQQKDTINTERAHVLPINHKISGAKEADKKYLCVEKKSILIAEGIKEKEIIFQGCDVNEPERNI